MTRRFVGTTVANLLFLFVLNSGCADNAEIAPDSGAIKQCAPGLKPMGSACVPIFDECKNDEVPMLGGGCKRVGVKECLDGWGLMGPPDWICKPIGPPRTCLKGWEKVAGGWCEPILPQTKCPVGMMAKIGYSTCQPVGDCGTGTWGNIKTTANTIYVDQGHKGAGGMGTMSEPYKTIEEALDYATPGAHIAVAAGKYNETLIINRKVTLEGRCAIKVTVEGGNFSFSYPALFLIGGVDIVIRGVTITGPFVGLNMEGGKATLDRVIIMRSAMRGIQVLDNGVLTIRDSLITENRNSGIFIWGAKATLERVEVRDTAEQASNNQYGTGIQVSPDPSSSASSELTVRDSLIVRNRFAGLLLESSKATLERTVVRGTREQVSDNNWGFGIETWVQPGSTTPSDLTVRDCVIDHNWSTGISLFSSKAMLERTVVRDNFQVFRNYYGNGIQAAVHSSLKVPTDLTVRDSMIEGNRSIGILVLGSKALLERTVVRETRGTVLNNTFGIGIQVSVMPKLDMLPELTVRDCLVAKNRYFGIGVFSAKAMLERTVVRDTRPELSSNSVGTGIHAAVDPDSSRPSHLTIRDCLIAQNRNTGVFLWSSKGLIERTVVQNTRYEVKTGWFGSGVVAKRQPGSSTNSEITMRESVISANQSAGIGLYESTGTLDLCHIRGTKTDTRGNFGDGVVVIDGSTLTAKAVIVDDSGRAGMVFWASGGEIHRSLIRGNIFAIDLENGAAPLIGEDNQMVDNQINHVTIGQGLKAPPIPSIPNL